MEEGGEVGFVVAIDDFLEGVVVEDDWSRGRFLPRERRVEICFRAFSRSVRVGKHNVRDLVLVLAEADSSEVELLFCGEKITFKRAFGWDAGLT